MTTRFDSYSAKASLKFYKADDLNEKLTIGFSIASNHQMDGNLYESINEFLDKILIGDYISEESYLEKIEGLKEQEEEEKAEAKLEKLKLKEQLRLQKEQERQSKEQMKKYHAMIKAEEKQKEALKGKATAVTKPKFKKLTNQCQIIRY